MSEAADKSFTITPRTALLLLVAVIGMTMTATMWCVLVKVDINALKGDVASIKADVTAIKDRLGIEDYRQGEREVAGK